MAQLIAEASLNVPADVVALTETERVRQTHLVDLGRPVRLVDARDPVVAPPVGEQARIVEAEHVDVRPVDEVVRQDADVAARVVRPDDADARRVVPVTRPGNL